MKIKLIKPLKIQSILLKFKDLKLNKAWKRKFVIQKYMKRELGHMCESVVPVPHSLFFLWAKIYSSVWRGEYHYFLILWRTPRLRQIRCQLLVSHRTKLVLWNSGHICSIWFPVNWRCFWSSAHPCSGCRVYSIHFLL